jgi:hypothetical protein
MPQLKFVPGYGPVEFPDEMSQEQIDAYINQEAAKQVPEMTGLPGVPLPKTELQYVNPFGEKITDQEFQRQEAQRENLGGKRAKDSGWNPLIDILGGNLVGGPLGAAVSAFQGQASDREAPRNTRELLGSYLGLTGGLGGNALLNRLTGGKVGAFNELRKGIAAGVGQYGGEKTAGGDPTILTPLSHTATGALGAGVQGLAGALQNSPRLLSNRIVSNLSEKAAIATDDIFNKNRGKFATPIRANLKEVLEKGRFDTPRKPSSLSATDKANQTKVFDEIGNLLGAKRYMKKNPASGKTQLYNYVTSNKQESLFPQRLANRLLPTSPNVNGKMLWSKVANVIEPENLKQAKRLTMASLLNKHFDKATGELKPSLLEHATALRANGILPELVGNDAAAKQVIMDLDNLIKAQRAIYKVNKQDIVAHEVGALTSSGTFSGYHTYKALAGRFKYMPQRAFNESVPNLAELANGIVNNPGKYTQSLQWLAKHGASAPTSLVRAVVSTLNTRE